MLDIFRCVFVRNQAKYRSGGVMTLEDETFVQIFDSVLVNNSAAYTGGVVLVSGSSKILFQNVKVALNHAQIGAVMCLQSKIKFQAINSTFSNNHESGYAGVFTLSHLSEAVLANCTFNHNTATAMARVAYVSSTLKISKTSYKNNMAEEETIYFFGRFNNQILT